MTMDLRDRLIAAHDAGRLLAEINTSALQSEEAVIDALRDLHNDGSINLVAAFQSLKNAGDEGINFFFLRQVFQGLLPHLNSPVGPMMECVLHLYKESGADITADFILQHFIAFCTKDPARPQEALSRIVREPERHVELLPAILISGSKLDPGKWLHEALGLLQSANLEIRRGAVFSLGRFEVLGSPADLDAALAALERVVASEADSLIRSAALRSAVGLLPHDKSQERRVLSLLDGILTGGDDHALFSAAEILSQQVQTISVELRNPLLQHLQRVQARSKGTLRQIDFALSRLMNSGAHNEAIKFVEEYLRNHASEVSIQDFPMLASAVRLDEMLLGAVITRWFLQGDPTLCHFASAILGSRHVSTPLKLKVSSQELSPKTPQSILFLAKKVVGYLYLLPITAISLLLSLMEETDDSGLLEQLGALVFDPLLVSFTGSAADYVAEEAQVRTGVVKTTLQKTKETFDDYVASLKAVGYIAELNPFTNQREANYRRVSLEFRQSVNSAQKQSPLLSMVHRSVLLYGNSSIDYVAGPNGETHRQSMPLRSIGTKFELPRLTLIDPIGIEHYVRQLKAEKQPP